MELQEHTIYRLRKALERALGKRIKSARDFKILSDSIYNQTQQNISPSTLKRLWGYYSDGTQPRIFTLDVLSQFLGYSDWDDFCRRDETCDEDMPEDVDSGQIAEHDDSISDADTLVDDVRQIDKAWRKYVVAVFVFLVLLLLGLLYLRRSLGADMQEEEMQSELLDKYILRKGQTFDSYEDYLKLFGITADARWWHQKLPHHDRIWIWGPQYRHPEWHNEGNADELMPTITEYWEPPFGKDDPKVMEVVSRVAHEGYYTMQNLNEVRIIFMSGLTTDSAFTFLGVYRMSMEQSDTTRIVWERVADECNLLALDYLEQFCR